jgi:P pilus assembly chaperone PapD
MNDQNKSNLTACSMIMALLVVVALMLSPAQASFVLAQTDPWVYNPANGHY